MTSALDRMWVLGGHRGTESGSRENSLNDAWYTKDGTQWMQAVSSTLPLFAGRGWFVSLEYHGKLWVIGGHVWHPDEEYQDVWCAELASWP